MSMAQRYAGFLDRESHRAATPVKGEAMRQAARFLLECARENARLNCEVFELQTALNFWLPCVPGMATEIAERIASDAGLLAGFSGDVEETAEAKGWLSLNLDHPDAKVKT